MILIPQTCLQEREAILKIIAPKPIYALAANTGYRLTEDYPEQKCTSKIMGVIIFMRVWCGTNDDGAA